MKFGSAVLLVLVGLTGCSKVTVGQPQKEPDNPCASFLYCQKYGWCTERDGQCVAATDAECARSEACRTAGTCSAHLGLCRPVAKDGQCDGLGSDNVNWCQMSGWCTVTNGLCGPGHRDDADCRRVPEGQTASPCSSSGHCEHREGRCVATSAEACKSSTACRESGYCAHAGLRCVATKASCLTSPSCRDDALCVHSYGVCLATDATCAATEQCRTNLSGCKAVEGACEVDPADFIYFQF